MGDALWILPITVEDLTHKEDGRGAWVAQWVKASAFGSGRDPGVLGSSPASGSLLSEEPASLPLSLPGSLPTWDLCQISK